MRHCVAVSRKTADNRWSPLQIAGRHEITRKQIAGRPLAVRNSRFAAAPVFRVLLRRRRRAETDGGRALRNVRYAAVMQVRVLAQPPAWGHPVQVFCFLFRYSLNSALRRLDLVKPHGVAAEDQVQVVPGGYSASELPQAPAQMFALVRGRSDVDVLVDVGLRTQRHPRLRRAGSAPVGPQNPASHSRCSIFQGFRTAPPPLSDPDRRFRGTRRHSGTSHSTPDE